jgi:hypothetical protein
VLAELRADAARETDVDRQQLAVRRVGDVERVLVDPVVFEAMRRAFFIVAVTRTCTSSSDRIASRASFHSSTGTWYTRGA